MTFTQTFALSDEQKMMTETVRRFIKTELQPLEDGIEVRGHLDADTARTVFAKANALGLYALNMPAEHGGGGQLRDDALQGAEVLVVARQPGHFLHDGQHLVALPAAAERRDLAAGDGFRGHRPYRVPSDETIKS